MVVKNSNAISRFLKKIFKQRKKKLNHIHIIICLHNVELNWLTDKRHQAKKWKIQKMQNLKGSKNVVATYISSALASIFQLKKLKCFIFKVLYGNLQALQTGKFKKNCTYRLAIAFRSVKWLVNSLLMHLNAYKWT